MVPVVEISRVASTNGALLLSVSIWYLFVYFSLFDFLWQVAGGEKSQIDIQNHNVNNNNHRDTYTVRMHGFFHVWRPPPSARPHASDDPDTSL